MGNLLVSQDSTNSTNNDINKLKKELIKISLDIERAQKRERRLLIENKELKEFINSDITNKNSIIDEAKEDVLKKKIDLYVEEWYRKNRDDIGKIDVLPDSVEKHLYKKMVHVMFAALMDIKLDVGRQIKLNIGV